jgi:hypothetical protein
MTNFFLPTKANAFNILCGFLKYVLYEDASKIMICLLPLQKQNIHNFNESCIWA